MVGELDRSNAECKSRFRGRMTTIITKTEEIERMWAVISGTSIGCRCMDGLHD